MALCGPLMFGTAANVGALTRAARSVFRQPSARPSPGRLGRRLGLLLRSHIGRPLWRFRGSPAQRLIPVYGELLSTWPVASGVLVEDDTAYFAAGIVNYDGTYVYAIDPATGYVKWCNDTSGHLDPQAQVGVSAQGHLLSNAGKLYLAGGNAVSPAIYDQRDGNCLNDPASLAQCESTSPRGWELFLVGDRVIACGRPYYAHPDLDVYDHTVSKKILHTSSGRVTSCGSTINSYSALTPLSVRR